MGLNPLVTREKRRKKELDHLKRITGGGGCDTKKEENNTRFGEAAFLYRRIHILEA